MMISQTGIDIKLRITFFDNFETDKVEVSFGARALMSEPEIGCDKSCAGRGAVLKRSSALLKEVLKPAVGLESDVTRPIVMSWLTPQRRQNLSPSLNAEPQAAHFFSVPNVSPIGCDTPSSFYQLT
jgi:hypothetical protein